jgi:hypothetical protein
MDKSGLQAATIGYNHPAHAKALMFSLNTACASYTEGKKGGCGGEISRWLSYLGAQDVLR